MLAPATAFLAAFTFAGYLSPIVAVVIAMLLIVIGMAFLRVKKSAPRRVSLTHKLLAAMRNRLAKVLLYLARAQPKREDVVVHLVKI